MNRAAEARRRRIRKSAVAAIASAALAPLLIYDGSVTAVLAQCEAFVRECLQALLQLSPAHWIAAALPLAGLAYAAADLLKQSQRVRRVIRLHRLRSPAPGEPIHALAGAHGMLGLVKVIDGPAPNPAFAAGLVRPRIYLAADLQREIRPEELRAIFRHELWHVRRRDPLRFALLRALGRFFFWLPIVDTLAVDLIDDAETLADDFAADASDPLELASALVAVAGRARVALTAAAGAGGIRPTDRRVRRLLDEDAMLPSVLPRRRLAISIGALLALWWVMAPGTVPAADSTRTASIATAALHCAACSAADVGAGHEGCHLLHLLAGRII